MPVTNGALDVSAAKVFDAEAAADLSLSHHQSGAIPGGYALRPVGGDKADGSAVEIPDSAT